MEELNKGLLDGHNMIRGSILNITVDIENIIDMLIARHFCTHNSRKIELINFLLPSDRISLDNKRQVLELILIEHYKELYDKTYNKVMKDLERRIIPKRNEFAHGKMHIKEFDDSSNLEDAKNHFVVGFLRYKKGKEAVSWYTYGEIVEFIKLMEATLESLGELFKIESPPQ
ncbi:MAG: hypothetical protein ACXVAY_06595 [Mucilaginibacter sp.]